MSYIIIVKRNPEFILKNGNYYGDMLYIVGHYNPAGKFIKYKSFLDDEKAEVLINYLNGGE